jgi:shikimate dehydrogenase
MKTLGFAGASVTVPHKETILSALDSIDPLAQRIGAVNTVLFHYDAQKGRTLARGFNTDWLGSNLALAEKLELAGSRVIVVGAGGAAKAVAFGLCEADADVLIVNRTVEKANTLAAALGCSAAGLSDLISLKADALVNTTSVGMTPHDTESPVPGECLSAYKVVMDIVYAPLQTRLLREAAAAGCQVIDGLAMLLYQGAAQFRIWTRQSPSMEVMRMSLEKELQRREDESNQ